MIKQDISTWENRWQAVSEYLNTLGDRNGDELCKRLFKILQTFGGKQFEFFLAHLRNGTLPSLNTIAESSPFKEYSLSYPIDDYILQTILDQILNDMLVIQRAQEQRIVSVNNSQQNIRDIWELADGLAFHGLQQSEALLAKTFWGTATPTVLTYLQKNPNVRVIPYAPVAVVGIPLTASTVPTDLLATAHELGHFLYWQGVTEQNQPYWFALREALEGADPKLLTRRWQEEIFADVIGLLIGGPVVAYSFQDLQLQMIGETFVKDNGAHPSPAIRPWVYTQALSELKDRLENNDFETAAQQLEERWQQVWTDRHLTLTCIDVDGIEQPPFQPRLPVPVRHRLSPRTTHTLSLDHVKSEFRKIIQTIFDLLPANWIAQRFVADPAGRTPAWTSSFDINKPYEEFTGRISELAMLGSAAKKTADISLDPNLDLYQKLLDEKVFPEPQSQLTSAITPETWLRILHFAGWATKGPGGDKIQGG